MPARSQGSLRRLPTLVLTALAGCEPKGADNLQGGSSSETGDSESTTEAGSEDTGAPVPECPPAGPVTDELYVAVDFPGHDDVDPEGPESERDATCMLVDSSGDAMSFGLELICDEIGGELQQPYTIEFESLQVPTTDLLSPDSPIDRSIYRIVGGTASRSAAEVGCRSPKTARSDCSGTANPCLEGTTLARRRRVRCGRARKPSSRRSTPASNRLRA